jgi:beta-glucanase (GH16 family)
MSRPALSNKFEFTGGYVQIGMKTPNGNGAWPALWMMPGRGEKMTLDAG